MYNAERIVSLMNIVGHNRKPPPPKKKQKKEKKVEDYLTPYMKNYLKVD